MKFFKDRNEPVDSGRWYINPDAFPLTGVKKHKIKFLEILSIIRHCIYRKTNIPWSDVIRKTREREIVFSRQMFHYFAKKYTKLSLSSIGAHGGNKDHATVLHSNRVVNNLIDTEQKTRLMIHDIDKEIKQQLSFNAVLQYEENSEIHDTIADWEKVKHKYINN